MEMGKVKEWCTVFCQLSCSGHCECMSLNCECEKELLMDETFALLSLFSHILTLNVLF